jgi:hypothetical protein
MDARLARFISTYPMPEASDEASRLGLCRDFWSSVEQGDRVALLPEILSLYRSCRQQTNPQNLKCNHSLRESFALNELIATGYKSKIRPDEQQALSMLRTAHHTCAHGNDVRPPVDFALRHFRQKPYTPEFFAALRNYRDTFRQSKPTTAQSLKAAMDLILWQDLAAPWKPCWTLRIRSGVQEMPPAERSQWADLFHGFAYTFQPGPPRNGELALRPALDKLSATTFRRRLQSWLDEPASTFLTSSGSHVIKNLVWCAILVGDPGLDHL